MTSTPVGVGAASYVTGAMTAVASSGGDVTNSFSDVLNSRKSEQRTAESKNEPVQTQADKRTERISEKKPKTVKEVKATDGKETAPEEAVSQAEKAAEEAAGQMLTKTAEELEIPEEEVLAILNSLTMTPMDLLQTENLQAVVLAAAGETDACALVADEQLFTSLQNLTEDLQDVVAQVAEATGLETTEVEEIFEGLMNQTGDETVQPLVEMPKEPVKTEENPMTERHVIGDGEKAGMESDEDVVSGKEIMLERSQTENSERGAESGFKENSTPNPFAQNPVVQNQTVAAVETAEQVSFFDTDTEMILNQITDYMKGQITEGVSELEMQLHPESLGNLHIRLTAKEGAVTAQFTAQNETVKAALESQMIQLKETFKEQGITVEAIEVTVESHRFDRNFGGNSNGAQDQERQPARTTRRRLNLNLITEEELTEEEQLATEMLKESGGTVDYTA